ncbi:YciI family protein [Micromonospora gifhornensis]|uniref:YCII-related domain-containing protein n=1 Tax=Micromonospora gifhornensis TaxID=84594 RepID=A0ABQ4II70_9ACTN|nr:YciI family protein [Micromonospora gifhornensis]GIJ17606.1 hypothetical protein Vgi01_42900 [Micromonospora gifhornensis]
MRYVLLIHSDPDSWVHPMFLPSGTGVDLCDARAAAFDRLLREITESGELIAASALADPVARTPLRCSGDALLATDDTMGLARSHLAGFLVVDVDSPQRAVEVAARIPAAGEGRVEMRPVMGLSGMEM